MSSKQEIAPFLRTVEFDIGFLFGLSSRMCFKFQIEGCDIWMKGYDSKLVSKGLRTKEFVEKHANISGKFVGSSVA